MGKPRFLEEIGTVWSTLSGNACKAGFKKCGIFPFNRFAIPESSFDPDALKRYKKMQNNEIQSNTSTLNLSDAISESANTAAEKTEELMMLPVFTDKPVPREDFLITDNENTKDDDIPPYLDNNDLLMITDIDDLVTANDDFITTFNTTDYNKTTSTSTSHQNASLMCDVSVQTDLALDRNISDDDFAFLQNMNTYFKRMINRTSRLEFMPQLFGVNMANQTSLPEVSQSSAFESCLLKTVSGNNQNSAKKRKAVGSNFAECLTTEAYVKKIKEENEKKEEKKRKILEKKEQIKLTKNKNKVQRHNSAKNKGKTENVSNLKPNLPGTSGLSEVKEETDQRTATDTEKKFKKRRRRVKNKKEETETSTDDDSFSLHSSNSSVFEEDFSSLSDDHQFEESNNNACDITVGSYVIVEYEGEFFPGMVTNKLEKEVEVSTMVMSGPKTWKWPERCDKIFYEITKIKEVIASPQLLNSRNNYSVPEISKYHKFM